MKIILEPHNPEWAIRFEAVRQNLLNILDKVPPISINHVGSTSIPDLIAKPVLDIDIIVRPECVAATRAALISAGYTDRGDMGIPDRYGFYQPGFGAETVAKGEEEAGFVMKCNTYVVLAGCQSLRNHLETKRVLLDDKELRQEYGDVKRELARQDLLSTNEYCRAKTGIMMKIWKKAGWSDRELEEVAMVNANA